MTYQQQYQEPRRILTESRVSKFLTTHPYEPPTLVGIHHEEPNELEMKVEKSIELLLK